MKRLIFSLLATASFLATPAFAADGDVVRTDYSNPYLLDARDTRLAFPDDTTVRSWGNPSAMTVEEAIISQWRIGGVMPIREGYSLVKFGTDPDVYAVAPGAVLRHITSPELATRLYGKNWEDRIINLFYSYWANYKVGTPVAEAEHPEGTIFKHSSSPVVYYLTNGVMRPFRDESSFLVNNFSWGSVITVSDSVKYVRGNTINGYERDLNGGIAR